MTYGYMGRLLDVDLSAGTFQSQEPDVNEVRPFIGGAGYNAWLLYQAVAQNRHISPLAPENPLIFGAGPLVGTPFPTAARCTFTALSPLTQIFGDSNGGGRSGVAMKRSGFDHLVIRGASERPCILVVGSEFGARIEAAEDLWGLNTEDAENGLQKKYPKGVVVTIGPAGENLVKYAAITSNENITIFGRSGMGAVMGSKRLKAIVGLGGQDIAVHDPAALKKMSSQVLKNVKSFPRPKLFQRYGTAMFLNMMVANSLMCGENWRRKIQNQDISSIDIGSYFDAAESKSHGCFRCPLARGKKWQIKEGPFQGEKEHAFEVDHIFSFGPTFCTGLFPVDTRLRFPERRSSFAAWLPCAPSPRGGIILRFRPPRCREMPPGSTAWFDTQTLASAGQKGYPLP